MIGAKVVRLSESREREIFWTLVHHLSQVHRPGNAHAAVAERFAISLDDLRAIERKGMAQNWPPLD
jgi:hypothetical protein